MLPSLTLSQPSRRRRSLAIAALPLLLALALLGVPAPGAADQHTARAGSVTVTPRSPMVGERTVFSGRLAGAGRPVTLHRRTSAGWQVVDRARVSGKRTYRLAVRVTKSGTYRVQARRAAGQPRFTSARIGVKVARQAAAIETVSAPFVVGIARTVTARVSPARNGRVVALQRLTGGSWTTVAHAKSNASGVAKINYAATTPGLAFYRVAGTRFHGSTAIGSARRTLRTARVTELLSGGTPELRENFSPSLSADGRWIAFTSEARLLASDTDDFNDVYLFDRRGGALTHLLPTADGHTNNPVLSANGRYVVLQSLATNLAGEVDFEYDVFALDRTTGVVDLISTTAAGVPANAPSYAHAISDDGRFVAFTSYATNLVTVFPPPNTSVRHAYLHDRTTEINRGLDRIGAAWADANVFEMSLSGDGTAVAFVSGDTDLDAGDVDGSSTFRWNILADGALDQDAGRTNLTPDIRSSNPALDRTGDLLVFSTPDPVAPGDGNGQLDAYLRTAGGDFVLASQAGAGTSESGDISAGGRYVAFSTKVVQPGDTNGAVDDIVVWDRVTNTRRLVTLGGPGWNGEPRLSDDGSVIAFSSLSTGLAPGTTGTSNIFAGVLR